MNALLRPAVVVMIVAPLAVCLLGLRFTCALADLGELMREARHAEELEWMQRATFRRMESKRQVVQEVIAGRCSLSEALAWFRGLERECPEYAAVVSKRCGPQGPDAERLYRNITALVRDLLGDRPAAAAAVLRRLEEDYRRLRAGRQATATAPMDSR
jgi:hypothetical protein